MVYPQGVKAVMVSEGNTFSSIHEREVWEKDSEKDKDKRRENKDEEEEEELDMEV